jgi:hypothetical protein
VTVEMNGNNNNYQMRLIIDHECRIIGCRDRGYEHLIGMTCYEAVEAIDKKQFTDIVMQTIETENIGAIYTDC